MGIDHFQLVMQ